MLPKTVSVAYSNVYYEIYMFVVLCTQKFTYAQIYICLCDGAFWDTSPTLKNNAIQKIRNTLDRGNNFANFALGT